MSQDPLKLVMMRNNFYRDNYRRVVLTLLVMVVINFGLVGGLVYMITHRPAPKYFATTAAGRIIPLYPLDEPMVSQAQLLQWASSAALSTFNFDFANWRGQLQKSSELFTQPGWTAWEAALKSTRDLQTVIAKKLVVHAVVTGAPVILQHGVLNGRYSWKIQMPLLVTYQSASTTFQQPVTVTMLITRVPVINFPRGIAIAQFFAAQQPIGSL